MKKTNLPPPTVTVLSLLVLLTFETAPAATVIWNGASGVDNQWSTAGNWIGGVVPAPVDDVKFYDDGADPAAGNVNNVVNAVFSGTVASLQYGNSNNFHTTQIESGRTLTVLGNLSVATGTDNGNAQAVLATITGPGAALVVSNTAANVIVRQGSANSGSALRATLDLSGLDTFTATVGRVLIGSETVNPTGGPRPAGTLVLARANVITASGSAPALSIGGIGGNNNNGGNSSFLQLGETNAIFVNSITVGRGKQGGSSSITFNTNVFVTPVGYFRGADRVSRIGAWNTSDSEGIGGTVNTRGITDLSGGRVDALVDTMRVARSSTGTGGGNPTGRLTFDQGEIDVNTLQIGVQGTSGANFAVGTVNVNGGTLLVNNTLELGHTAGGTGVAGTRGVLNITGGTVRANVITAGDGTNNAITLESGTLAVTNGAGPGINDFSLTDSTLEFATVGVGSSVVVTNLTTGGTGNTISVGLFPAITSYPATFPLIKYQGAIGGSGYNFTLTGVSGAYAATLVDNAPGQSVDLVVTAGPIAQALTWVGTTNGNWDTTTKNWRAGSVSTNFFSNDFSTFDDTAPGLTTINLVTTVRPGNLTVNNTSLAYTFSGSGGIAGLGELTKQGAGTLLINNSGANTYLGSTIINGGTVQVGDGGTSGSLGLGEIQNNASLVVNRGDNVSLGNNISGSGALTKSGAGLLTLSGANTFDGAVTIAQGTLKTGNNSVLGTTNGTTTIEGGATLDVGANNINLGLERIFVSGAGVGGNGAIINSSGSGTFVGPNVAFVTLTGDTTFGGTGRWDLRSSATANPAGAALSTGGNPYKLTKVGPNGVYLPGVTVDPALGEVDIQQGTLAIESGTTGLGNPASTLTVHAGATLQLYNMTNLLNKQINLNGSGTNNTVNNASGANTVIGPMTLNGDCLFNAGGTSLTLSNTVGGNGSFIKVGSATLTLTGGADTYAGNTTVSNGTLVLNNLLNGGGTLTTLTNTTLAGNGTNTGPVIVGGTLSPGDSAGTFGSGNLTLQPGAALVFELNSVNTVGSGVNDLIEVNGDLAVNGNSFTFSLLGGSLQVGTYRLINYSGNLIGNLDTAVSLGGASRYSLALNTNTPGQVNLVVTGTTADLVWNSTSSTAWDVAVSSNWFNTGTMAADAFYQADDVRFEDTAGVMTIIDIADAVAPATITIDATNNAYTFNGPGKISGGANLVKKGDSTLLVNSTNDFAGTVTLQRGILQLGNNASLGSTAGGTIISDGATLDIGITDYAANTVNIGVEPLTVSGAGYAGQGAIVNNSANAQQNAVRAVTLAGNASFGGNSRWDIRGAGALLSTGGNPYKITKIGANQLSIVGANVDPALGDIEIQAGTLSFETGTTSAGDPTKTLTVQPGGTLQVYQLLVALDKRIILNGDGSSTSFYNNNGVNTVSGPMTLNGNCVLNVGGTSLTLLNTLSGAGGLTKIGNNVLSLSGASTYSGDTVVNAGTLALTGTGSISGSSNIVLAAATTLLDVSARTDGTLTLPGGRTLTGNGTIRGSLQVNAGATLSPGNPSLGVSVDALTVTDVVTLGGTNIMEIDKSNLTNDVIRGAASIQYGGTLSVAEISSTPFADGDRFKLFEAASYSGAFTSITPATPASGLFWDTSELTSSGTLKVVATAPPPSITSVVKSGNNIVFGGSGGLPGGPYYVLVSADLALPISSWTPVVTNTFGAGGEFSFTEAVIPNVPRRFFLLQVP